MSEAETKEPTPKAWIRLGHTKCCEIVGFEAIGTEHTCFAYVAGGPVADWILKRVNSTPALVAAAEAALAWRVADFDTIAEMFYRDTGYLRPGKDYPALKGGETVRKEAEAVWNVWVDRKNAELTDQLTAAIAAAKKE